LAITIYRVEWNWVRMLSDFRKILKDMVSWVLGMIGEIEHSLDW
jgi:hypothetical protein